MGPHRLRTRISVLCRVLDQAAVDSDAEKHFYVVTKGAHASLGSRFGLCTSSKLQDNPHTVPNAAVLGNPVRLVLPKPFGLACSYFCVLSSRMSSCCHPAWALSARKTVSMPNIRLHPSRGACRRLWTEIRDPSGLQG